MHGQRHVLQGWMDGWRISVGIMGIGQRLPKNTLFETRHDAARRTLHRAASSGHIMPSFKTQSDHWIDNILAHYWARQAQRSEGKVWSVDRPSELQNTG